MQIKPFSLRAFVQSAPFRNAITAVILLSGIIIGMETYPEFYRKYHAVLHRIDQIILLIFAIEIFLRILSFGRQPWDYFKDPWNVFDFVIVAVCFLPLGDTHYLAVLRLARLLRVLRVITIMPKLQLLVGALLKSIPSMGYVILLLAILFFIYAVLGSFLYGPADPVHFGNLHLSMITLFKILTLEGWTDIMNYQFYGTADPTAEYSMKPASYGSFFYFVSFILIGAMIIMNLFIGVIMNSMQESHKELEKSLTDKKSTVANVQSMIEMLDKKLDEIKKDLALLGNAVDKGRS